MITTGNGAELAWQTSTLRWSAGVPVPEAERRHTDCDGPEHKGALFEVRTLRVYERLDGNAAYQVSGPNIRADGSFGKYWLRQRISVEAAARDYPQAWTAMVTALQELAQHVRADGARAAVDIIWAAREQETGNG